jgi:hypothetical protein
VRHWSRPQHILESIYLSLQLFRYIKIVKHCFVTYGHGVHFKARFHIVNNYHQYYDSVLCACLYFVLMKLIICFTVHLESCLNLIYSLCFLFIEKIPPTDEEDFNLIVRYGGYESKGNKHNNGEDFVK